MGERRKVAKFDLSGRRFGRLTALESVTDQNGRAVWKCRCDCGSITYATTGHLNSGTKKSCGCLRLEKQRDLTGQRFGRLTVLEKTDRRSPKNRSVLWRCQCTCGNICLKPTNELNSGFATSCGCMETAPDKKGGRGSLTYVDDTCIEFLEKIHVPTKASTTGVRGVTLRKDGRYQASLTFRKKRRYLGIFLTIEEAARARKQAEDTVREYLKSYRDAQPGTSGKS